MTHQRTASLAQTPTGWLWREQGRKFKTAKAAVDAVNRDGAALAGKANISVYIIQWHTTSLAGRIIASSF